MTVDSDGEVVYITSIDGGWVSGYTRNQVTGVVNGVKTSHSHRNALKMKGKEMDEVYEYLFDGRYDYHIFKW